MKALSKKLKYLIPILLAIIGLIIFFSEGKVFELHSQSEKKPLENQLKEIFKAFFSDENYSLSKLRLFSLCMKRVEKEYLYPNSIDWQLIFEKSLENVQKQIPELLFDMKGMDKNYINIIFEDTKSTFSIKKIENLSDLLDNLSRIFLYLEKVIGKDVSPVEIEYSAINGAMKTLDPHSQLLPPKDSEELQIENRGEFGGIGIVISIRNDFLTIISPLEGTPAWKAGLRPGDRIIEINDESTINMSLYDAVEKLRGPKGTSVRITVERQGLSTPFSVLLIRDTIVIKVVSSRYLGDGVGYVRLIDNFTEKTYDEMKRHITKMKRMHPEMNSLILDLRGNTGGYFTQSVKVADAFLKEGIIVTTVGRGGASRDVKKATLSMDDFEDLRIALLIDGGTASAAEIVAGALKNNDRAIVLGMRSFGKGTVQNLYQNYDGSSFKLTVSEYLTPGDRSIQSSGIIPDILILPVSLKKDKFLYNTYQEIMREEDIRPIKNGRKSEIEEKSSFLIRYYDPEIIVDPSEEDIEKSEKKYSKDYIPRIEEVSITKHIISNVKSKKRSDMLKELKPIIDEWKANQEKIIEDIFRNEGIDWSISKKMGESKIETTINFMGINISRLRAGRDYKLKVNVRNAGKYPLYRLRGVVNSNFYFLNNIEFPIGKIPPFEEKDWIIPVHVPESVIPQTSKVSFKFFDDTDKEIGKNEMTITTEALPPPRYSLSYQFYDENDGNLSGNGDGFLQRGETVKMLFYLGNSGEGISYDTKVKLINNAGNKIFIKEGIFQCGEIRPDETCRGYFIFTFNDIPDLERRNLEIIAGDYKTKFFFSKNIDLKEYVAPPMKTIPLYNSMGEITKKIELRDLPSFSSHPLALIDKKEYVPVNRRTDNWIKLSLNRGITGWIPKDSLKFVAPDVKPDLSSNIKHIFMYNQPSIHLVKDPPLVISGNSVHIEGSCKDDTGIKDIYIFVNDRKAFYKTGIDETGSSKRYKVNLHFSENIPFDRGENLVSISCRNKDEILNSTLFYTVSDMGD